MDKLHYLRWNQFHWAALTFSVVLAAKPMTIFLNSSQEFSLSLSQAAIWAGLILLKLVAVLYLAGLIFNLVRKIEIWSSLLLALTVALWLQGYLFLWNYGQLDGRPFSYDAHDLHGLLEFAVWAVIFGGAVWKCKILSGWGSRIFIFISVTLALNMGHIYTQMPPVKSRNERYAVSDEHYDTFSKKCNVIILTIDSARGDIFEEIFSGLNEEDKALFDGFTFFQNTVGTFLSTVYAVPGILTSRHYDCKVPLERFYQEVYTSPSSIPWRLKQAGFVSEIYPYPINANYVYLSPQTADNLKSMKYSPASPADRQDWRKIRVVAAFNFSPHFFKKRYFDASAMFFGSISPPLVPTNNQRKSRKIEIQKFFETHIATTHRQIEKLGSDIRLIDQPMFKYLHFHGSHFPFIHDENFMIELMPSNLDSYKRQYKGSLLLTIKSLIGSLQRQGVYNETMLVVLGDHGLFVPSIDPTRSKISTEFNMEAVDMRLIDGFRPLLLVKPFQKAQPDHARLEPLKTSAAPVSLSDVPATVFEALGIQAETQGRSVFEVRDEEDRPRQIWVPSSTSSNPSRFFEFEVNGHVSDLGAWKPSLKICRKDLGIIESPPLQYVKEYKLYMVPFVEFIGSEAMFLFEGHQDQQP